MQFVLNPVMDYYAARQATGKEKLSALKGPVILVANHASHMDTPVILSALPRQLRKRTAVAAAADYFYRNRLTASLVSLIFNTVPIERRKGNAASPRTRAISTRCSTTAGTCCCFRRERDRAAALRDGSGEAPPCWRPRTTCRSSRSRSPAPPRRCRPAGCGPSDCTASCSPGAIGSRSRSASRSAPAADTQALIERVQTFFDTTSGGGPSINPYRRRDGKGSEAQREADRQRQWLRRERQRRRAQRSLVVLVEPVGRPRDRLAPLAVAPLDLVGVVGSPLRGHVPVGAELLAP